MSRAWRIHQIDQLLRQRRQVTRDEFLAALECSRATFKRDLEFLRDQLNAPIVYDAEAGAYRLDQANAVGPRYSLPGLWFSAGEIHALVVLEQLLGSLEPGVLGAQIAPLRERLHQMMSAQGQSPAEITRRIRVIQTLRRQPAQPLFPVIARAVMTRTRLTVQHLDRQSGESRRRDLSPQRLVHYRENWYLDAWCHWRQAIRSFALDAIEAAELSDLPAREIPDVELDAVLAAGYGIFAGADTCEAELVFSAARAPWVSGQCWHPAQQADWLPDGRYRLRLPYADDRELLNDIQAHLPEVEVISPPALRLRLRERLQHALALHGP